MSEKILFCREPSISISTAVRTPIPGMRSCLDLARQARDAGMRAIVLKDQMTQSIHKAYFVNKYIEGIQAFGGITLNRMVGGYDLRTVEFACRLGAKMIWFATHDSGLHDRGRQEGPLRRHLRQGLFVRVSRGAAARFQQGENGSPPGSEEDHRSIARHRVILQTAHIDPEEALAVARYCKKIGHKKLVITHVNSFLDEYTDEIIDELIRNGAMIEISYSDMVPRHARQDPHVCARLVDRFGPTHSIMESDLGTWENVSPTEGLRCFCHYLAYCGVPADYVNLMVKDNPARLLGLS